LTPISKEPHLTSTSPAAPPDGISFRTLIRRAAWPLAIKALPALYGAGLVLFVIRILPPGEFGRYGIAFAFINLAAVFTRGLWAIPLVTWAARREEPSVLGPVFWLSLGSAAVAAVIALFLLPLIGVSGYLPWMCGLMLIVLVPRELAYALAQGHGRPGVSFLIEVSYFAGSFALFAVLWWLGRLQTAESALTANLVCAALSSILGSAAYPVIIRPVFTGEWMRVFHFGKWVGGLGLAEVYFQQGDALLIALFVNPSQIAPYLAARTLLRLYGILSQAINFVVLPVASRLAAAGQLLHLRRRLWQVLKYLLTSLLVLNVVVWLISPAVLTVLFQDKYVGAIPFFRVLLLVTFLEPLYIILGNAVAGIGRPKEVFKAIPLAVLFNVVFNVTMIPVIGLQAAPWALIGAYALLAVQLIRTSSRLISGAATVSS
jgi:lipopolysaccharide exporter